MWPIVDTDVFVRQVEWYGKKKEVELDAVPSHLDIFVKSLDGGKKPKPFAFGFLHSEPSDIIAVDQRGAGRKLAETRLYVYPDIETDTLYLLTIGNKSSRGMTSRIANDSSPGSRPVRHREEDCTMMAEKEMGAQEQGLAKDKSMNVTGRKYASVLEMVRENRDAEFAGEFEDHLARHAVSRIPTVLRCRKGMTQGQVAEEMGCGQAKVSKIERSPDVNPSMGDIADYLVAVGHAMHVVFAPIESNGSDHIRFHVDAIGHHLDRLVGLAGVDRPIGEGIEAFASKNIRDLIAMVGHSPDQLALREPELGSPIRVGVAGDRGDLASYEAPRRVRRASKKPTAAP